MKKQTNPSLAVFFKALCDPNRLCILAWLARHPEPKKVGEVASCCDVDLSVVSRHLSILKSAGVLTAEKRGKEVYYQINTELVSETLKSLMDSLTSCCPLTEKKIEKTNPKENRHGTKKRRSKV